MAAEISALLDLLRPAAAGDRDPPSRRLRTAAARAGLEALAGALAAGPPPEPARAGAVLAAARAVVSTVLSSSGELPRSIPRTLRPPASRLSPSGVRSASVEGFGFP